ncbi:MAG: synthase chain [Micavibrio sp.]|nr:synthase chain [Micavibrio sp.]
MAEVVALATPEELSSGTAHTEHAKSGGLPQFDPTSFSSQLVWLALVFAFLYFVFSRFSLPKIGRVVETRNDKINLDRDTAERLTAEAQTTMEAYEKSLAQARNESARFHAESADTIKKQTEDAMKVFAEKSEKQLKATEKRLEDGKAQVMDEMHTIAAEIASAAAEKIVGISTDLSAAKTVVQSVNSKLSKAA